MVRHSGATHRNEAVQDWSADFGGRDNLSFFQAALEALAQSRSQGGPLVAVGLVGAVRRRRRTR